MDDEFVTLQIRVKKRELKHLLRGTKRVIDSEKAADKITRRYAGTRNPSARRLKAFTRLRTAIESVIDHVINEEGSAGAATIFDTTSPRENALFDTTAPGT